MNSAKAAARSAGILYLLMSITGAFSILYLPVAFIVGGDAMATARKITDGEFLYRIVILSDLVSQILFVFLVFSLYNLLKDVSRRLAMLMVMLVLISVAVGVANLLNQIAPLVLLSGADFLSVFTKPQLDATALGFLKLHGKGVLVDSVFWGLWLFPFGLLVIKSGFIPRFLGGLLIIAGVAYLAGSFIPLLIPDYPQILARVIPVLEAAELPIIFWLLIVGVTGQPTKDELDGSNILAGR
jgi:Domain of unknown function (DUF4386)